MMILFNYMTIYKPTFGLAFPDIFYYEIFSNTDDFFNLIQNCRKQAFSLENIFPFNNSDNFAKLYH